MGEGSTGYTTFNNASGYNACFQVHADAGSNTYWTQLGDPSEYNQEPVVLLLESRPGGWCGIHPHGRSSYGHFYLANDWSDGFKPDYDDAYTWAQTGSAKPLISTSSQGWYCNVRLSNADRASHLYTISNTRI